MERSAALDHIFEVRSSQHGAGTLSEAALRTLARHASEREIRHSAETGCGVSTLVLSHLSGEHTVFALDLGGSLTSVRQSELLRPGAVTFVEGPTQRTLPNYRFPAPLQLALLDGPHAYPYPDLEYYFLYPHLEPGALLVVDDIQIRSVHHLFEFLRCDAMFRLEEVVRNTAFFTRTGSPVFDPFGDGWEQQNYNRRTLLRHDWRSRVARMLPRRWSRRWGGPRRPHCGCRVEILTPAAHEVVGDSGWVHGSATLEPGTWLWILVHRRDVAGWWPQAAGPVAVTGEGWQAEVRYGNAEDAGYQFEIAAVAAGEAIHERWLQWVREAQTAANCPPVSLPERAVLHAEVVRRVRKRRA